MIDAMPTPSDLAPATAESTFEAGLDPGVAKGSPPAHSPSEQQLQLALSQGEWRAAILVCAREYGPDVGRLCMAMLSERALAEETAQEVFVAAFEALPNYRAEAPVRAWLLGIARKKCLRALEQRRRRQQLVLDTMPPTRDLDELLTQKARAERARIALTQIKPSEREALLLRYQSELSYDDIAAVCTIDNATARKRVSRALLNLRALLAQPDFDSSKGQP